jgi:hypothetical protein
MEEISETLLGDVIASPHLADLLLSLELSVMNCQFLFEYFKMVLRCSHNTSKGIDATILKQKCSSLAKTDSQFATAIYSDYDSALEFLLMSSQQLIRISYLELLVSASVAATEQSKRSLLSHSLDIVLSKRDEVLGYWTNFDEFFQLFFFLIDLADLKTWPLIFFDFIATSILEFHDPKTRNVILDSVNLSAVFDLLNKLFELTARFASFRSQVLDSSFFVNFLPSSKHSRAFTRFLMSFKFRTEDVLNIVIRLEGILSPATLAGFVIIGTSVSESTISYFLRLLGRKPASFIQSFLDELVRRLSQFQSLSGNFMVLAEKFIRTFLLTGDADIRHSILALDDRIHMRPASLYALLISEMSHFVGVVQTVTEDLEYGRVTTKTVYQHLPTKEFFELLKRSTVPVTLKKLFIREHSLMFLSVLKKFAKLSVVPNQPLYLGLLFLCNLIGSDFCDLLFEAVNFSNFLGVMASLTDYNEYTINLFFDLLNMIPFTKIDEFFANPVFNVYCRFIFKDPTLGNQLKTFILQRCHPGNATVIARNLWDPDCVSLNVRQVSHEFFALS